MQGLQRQTVSLLRQMALIYALLFSVAVIADSEYDLFRSPSTETQTMVLLDASLMMGCAPQQDIPPEGAVACPYDTQGAPPFPLSEEKTQVSRLALVKNSFEQILKSDDTHYVGEQIRLGLATYSGEGAAIRLPLGMGLASDASAFQRELSAVGLQGEAPLLGSLVEVVSYFAGKPMIFGGARQTLAHDFHTDNSLVERYQGFLPRWRQQRISHPDALVGGNFSLQRDAACTAALNQFGPDGGNDPSCESEHYERTKSSPILYATPATPHCDTSDEPLANTVAPPRQLVLIASQEMNQINGLEQVVAGERLGVWINRLLTGDADANGFHEQCSLHSTQSEKEDLDHCAQALAALLKERYNVTLSVIGLGFDSASLNALAAAGGGGFYSVSDEMSLTNALPEALAKREIATVSVTAQQASSIASNDLFYMAVFQPSPSRRWYGNLKRYQLSEKQGQLRVLSEKTAASDAEDVIGPCADGSSGCIQENARSAWSSTTTPDGNVATRGGAAEKMPTLSKRAIFVQQDNKLIPISAIGSEPSLVDLSGDQRAILTTLAKRRGWQGADLEKDLSAPTVRQAWNDYHWLAGADRDNVEYERLKHLQPAQHPLQHNNEEGNYYGAPVFGAPLLVNYDASTSDAAGRNIVWFSSSDGFLRGIDAATGDTLVSIFPEALLDQVADTMTAATGDVIPGLDTRWVVYRNDVNRDGKIRSTDGDFVYLYGGMRRGGQHILAWNITQPESPSLLFDIDNTTSGFEALAYTWSTPLLANVILPGQLTPETLLIFGAGYDNSLDDTPPDETTICRSTKIPCGAALYFVSPEGSNAGKLRWTIDAQGTASNGTRHSDINAPLAAPVKALDFNGDSIADYLYAVDLQGQVFRVRLPTAIPTENSLVVTTLAHLGTNSGSAAIDRHFFFAPSVATTTTDTGQNQVVLALGSGTITQPWVAPSDDYLFLVADSLTPQQTPLSEPINLASSGIRLLDAEHPSDIASTGAGLSPLVALPLPGEGERLLNEPLIIDHKAFFPTYTPPALTIGQCTQSPATRRLWGIDIRTAKPVFDGAGNINSSSPETYHADAMALSGTGSLLPVVNADGTLTVLSDLTSVDGGSYPTTPDKLRWRHLMSGVGVKNR